MAVSVKVLVAIFLAVSIVGISVSLVVVDSVLSQRVRDEQIVTNRFGRAVSRRISLEMTTAVESASLLTGMVHGIVPKLPAVPDSRNFTLPSAVMARGWFVLSTLTSPLPGLKQITLYPADNLTQMFPFPDEPPIVPPTAVPNVVISRLRNATVTSAIGPLRAVDNSVVIAIAAPVYNRTFTCTPQASNGSCVDGTYWGHSRSYHSLAGIIGDVEALPGADAHNYMICARNVETGKITRVTNWTRPDSPSMSLATDLPPDSAGHAIGIHVLGTDAYEQEWLVRTHRRGGFTESNDSRAYAGAILASIAAGFVVVVLVVVIGIVVARAQRRDASGPLQGPLAIVVLEIDETATPWAVAPAAASETINAMMAACRREAERFNGFGAQLVGDGMLIVATKPADALEIAHAMNEWAAANDWPEAVRLQRSKLRPLRLRVAVHWGRDITNRTPEEDRPEYAGADADYAIGMRSLCPCTRVTVTPAFRRACLRNGIPPETFVSIGTTVPSDDGIVYGAYVARSRRDGAAFDASTLSIDDEDRCLWNISADPEPTLLTSTVSQDLHEFDNSNIPGIEEPAPPQSPPGSGDNEYFNHNDPGDGFNGIRPDTELAGTGRPPPAPRPTQRASARGVAASKQRQIDAALSHPAFTHHEHAPWLPARACEVQEIQKLHSILQDHITTPDEANHYSALLTVATYNYQAFSFMLGPLTSAERNNVARRLQSAFGVPEKGFLQRLAVHTAIVSFRSLPMPPAMMAPCRSDDALDEQTGAVVAAMNTSAPQGSHRDQRRLSEHQDRPAPAAAAGGRFSPQQQPAVPDSARNERSQRGSQPQHQQHHQHSPQHQQPPLQQREQRPPAAVQERAVAEQGEPEPEAAAARFTSLDM